MLPLVLSAALAAPAQPPSHDAANAVYKGLLDPGLVVGPTQRVKFAPPVMADGLSAAQQKAVIEKVIGTDYPFAEFTRQSVVAPQVVRIGDARPSDPAAPARTVDVYFVAYGDFAATDDEKFLDRLTRTGQGTGTGRSLSPADLEKRKIIIPDPKREGFGLAEFDFLEKVRLKLTGHAAWSKTADSVAAAAEVDPRFTTDAEFPNQWKSLSKEGGAQKVGPATPYGGAGMYLKMTRLHEPAGAIFVEQHVVFAEPAGWFAGANLLRSKLPAAVQINVRAMRREWLKGR
ncbi:hypothetical protein [Urbifossiella limnaea]|uniref:Uncharacterized protein n=1 Tax=Urbifossiella limnaea TaxID=2528023 RepID=A0A517XU65_9BACT|nr:hypothetical protein [Urbifossiella limnaea]QDU21050.1 hypothetical protein ETAA1_30140 [Urbifossiella limnaea]